MKKNITMMAFASIAIFIYMIVIGNFLPIRKSGILPSAIGFTIGFIVFYLIYGTRFEGSLKKIITIGFGFPITGLFIGISNPLNVEVTFPILIVFLIIGVFISVIFFRLLEAKTDRRKIDEVYKTDERQLMLNEKSASIGFIFLSLFLLAYLLWDYLETGIFDNTLIFILVLGWIALILSRFYYEWKM